MKIRLTKIILPILLVVFTSSIVNSQVTIQLNNHSELIPGDTIDMTMSISGLEDGQNVIGFQGAIMFDHEKIEFLDGQHQTHQGITGVLIQPPADYEDTHRTFMWSGDGSTNGDLLSFRFVFWGESLECLDVSFTEIHYDDADDVELRASDNTWNEIDNVQWIDGEACAKEFFTVSISEHENLIIGDTVDFMLSLSGVQDDQYLSEISATIEFNSDNLELLEDNFYEEYQLAGVQINSNDSYITFEWDDPSSDVSNGDLFSLSFVFRAPPGDCETLVFADSPVNKVTIDNNSFDYPTDWVNGVACGTQPFVVSLSEKQGLSLEDTIAVTMSINDIPDDDNLSSISGTIQFDNQKLEFIDSLEGHQLNSITTDVIEDGNTSYLTFEWTSDLPLNVGNGDLISFVFVFHGDVAECIDIEFTDTHTELIAENNTFEPVPALWNNTIACGILPLIFSMSSITEFTTNEEVEIIVSVDGLEPGNNLTGVQGTIDFNPDILNYLEDEHEVFQSISGLDVDVPPGFDDAKITFLWSDNNSDVVNGELFMLKFLYTGDFDECANLSFTDHPTDLVASDNNFDERPAEWENIEVCATTPDPITISLNNDEDFSTGDIITLVIEAEGLDDETFLTGFQGTIEYNPDVLNFIDDDIIEYQGISGLDVDRPSGFEDSRITFLWSDESANLTNGDLFAVRFVFTGNNTDCVEFNFIDFPTDLVCTDNSLNFVYTEWEDLEICPTIPDPITISLNNDEDFSTGDIITLVIEVEGLDDETFLTGFQGTIEYNPDLLSYIDDDITEYQGISNLNVDRPSGFEDSRITFLWSDESANVTNGDLFAVRFVFTGNNTDCVEFNFIDFPTDLVCTDNSLNFVYTEWEDLEICPIEPEPLVIRISNIDDFAAGDMVSFVISAEDLDPNQNIIGFQWTLEYDPDLLEYIDNSETEYQGISNTLINRPAGFEDSRLTFIWSDDATNVTEGDLISIDFIFIGNNTDCVEISFIDFPTDKIITNDNYVEIPTVWVDAHACATTPSDAVFRLSNHDNLNYGDIVEFVLSVDEMPDDLLLNGFQGTLDYDPNLLEYLDGEHVEYQSITGSVVDVPTGFETSRRTFIWSHPAANSDINSGNLIGFKFRFLGDQEDCAILSFIDNPTDLVAVDQNMAELDSEWISGEACGTGPDLVTVSLSDHSNLEHGDIITVIMSISNLENDQKLSGIQGTIEYDSDVLEFLDDQHEEYQSISGTVISSPSGYETNRRTFIWGDWPTDITNGDLIGFKFRYKGTYGACANVRFVDFPTELTCSDDLLEEIDDVQWEEGTICGIEIDPITVQLSNHYDLNAGDMFTIVMSISGLDSEINLSGIQGTIEYDPEVLEYLDGQHVEFQNITGTIISSPTGFEDSRKTFVWGDWPSNVNNGDLIGFTFVYHDDYGACAEINFIDFPTDLVATDEMFNEIPVQDWIGGEVCGEETDPLVVSLSNHYDLNHGDTIELVMSISGVPNTLNLSGIQGTIEYDPDLLEYIDGEHIEYQNISGTTIGIPAGFEDSRRTFVWSDWPTDLHNGDLVGFKFIFLGESDVCADISFVDFPTDLIANDQNFEEMPVEWQNGIACSEFTEPIIVSLSEYYGAVPGDIVTVEMQISGIPQGNSLSGIHGTIEFDNSVLEFIEDDIEEYQSVSGTIIDVPAGFDENRIIFSSSNWDTDAVNGNLIGFKFIFIGGEYDCSTVEFVDSPAVPVANDQNNNEYDALWVDGIVCGDYTVVELSNHYGLETGETVNVIMSIDELNFGQFLSGIQGTIDFNPNMLEYLDGQHEHYQTVSNAVVSIPDDFEENRRTFVWSDWPSTVTNGDLIGFNFVFNANEEDCTEIRFKRIPTDLVVNDNSFNQIPAIWISGLLCGHYPEIDVIDIYDEANDINVCIGTPEDQVFAMLPEEISISHVYGDEYVVELDWQIDNYNQNVVGVYQAYGSFELPQDVAQTDPETDLQVVVNIFVNELPVLNLFIYEGISCYGESDAVLFAEVLNVDIDEYVWSVPDSENSNYLHNVGEGEYSVTVIDVNSCTVSDMVYVNPPDPIIVEFDYENVQCKGESTGWAEAVVSGGVGNYWVEWQHNNSTQFRATNLSAGVYYVDATDGNGCKTTAYIEIIEPELGLTGNVMSRDLSCYRSNDGEIIAEGVGGYPPYTYEWMGPQQYYSTDDGIVRNLVSGNYTVIIKDTRGCEYESQLTIREPERITFEVKYFEGPSCRENFDGYIVIDDINGGTAPYWVRVTGDDFFVEQQSFSIDSLFGGTYNIDVVDVNNCTQYGGSKVVNLVDTDVGCIQIPAAFSPNDDGYNDEWQIDNLHLYPRAFIQVYNRWGQIVYEATSGDDFWNGRYMGYGTEMPTGSYIYHIDLFNDSRPITGIVTIVR